MSDLLLGAVAYDPKVVTIWNGFRDWLRARDFDMDYVLYAHYERQAEDLVSGHIDAAWNSPLSWLRSERLARAAGTSVEAVLMRDTDRDLTSAVVVRADSPFTTLADLAGHTVAVGAIDSPQATLLPVSLLRQAGLRPSEDVQIRRFDVGVGLHGDHVGGERDAMVALRDGEVAAATVLDANIVTFGREGTIAPGSVRVLAETPAFDHCNMTIGPAADPAAAARFTELLLSMSYADPEARPLLDLEGLTQWLPGRTELYADLDRAVDEADFYGPAGELRAQLH